MFKNKLSQKNESQGAIVISGIMVSDLFNGLT